MKMKYPQKLLSFRNLQGGQFGSIDVTAISDDLVELDFGADFDRLSPTAARRLVHALNDWLDQLPDVDAPASSSAKEVVVVIER